LQSTTVIIGAGHTGLAMSRCLTARSVDHVVLERGEVANSWRKERWDSLRLLTPNWECRLPDYEYEGGDPDGFMTMPEVVDFIATYAKAIEAPVHAGTTVSSVRRVDDGYRVTTDQGVWSCETVVLATGAFNLPNIPALAAAVPPSVTTLSPMTYRNPSQLDDGGVLVVGASATGVQIAHEVQQSGRRVILAVGEHVRAPRQYRGRDIHWWMDAAGVLDERYDEVDDIVRARHVPSMQLAGSADLANFDLNALTGIGVQIVGRFAGINGTQAQFSGSLRNKCELADLKLGRLLTSIDEWATSAGLDDVVPAAYRLAPTNVPPSPRLGLDLSSGEICTIIWAPQVDAPPRRRGGVRSARYVRDRPAIPAQAKVELHRRRAPRRRGTDRRVGCVPRRPRVRAAALTTARTRGRVVFTLDVAHPRVAVTRRTRTVERCCRGRWPVAGPLVRLRGIGRSSPVTAGTWTRCADSRNPMPGSRPQRHR
jgi:putative flavoprotein involved in K+ transport